jgi:hypothetical protein
MTHYFVTCFWGSDPLRIKLCQEFCNRYPQVHLLQNGNFIKSKSTTIYNLKEGFQDYRMINEFLKGKEVKSLTLIDSDLILKEDFFIKFIEKHDNFKENVPYFLTYRQNYQLNEKIVSTCCSKIYSFKNCGTEGHTGYVLSFNKFFLDNYKFNEKFIYGGYDYFLVCSILGKCMEQFQNEYKKVPKTKYDYVKTDVIHNFHGISTPTPWSKYSFS